MRIILETVEKRIKMAVTMMPLNREEINKVVQYMIGYHLGGTFSARVKGILNNWKSISAKINRTVTNLVSCSI